MVYFFIWHLHPTNFVQIFNFFCFNSFQFSSPLTYVMTVYVATLDDRLVSVDYY